MSNQEPDDLPLVIAGPILRQATHETLVIWLATTQACSFRVFLANGSSADSLQPISASESTSLRIGRSAYISLLEIDLSQCQVMDQFTATKRQNQADTPPSILSYDIGITPTDCQEVRLSHLSPELLYAGASTFTVAIHHQIKSLYHGSCRKPHHVGPDALVQMDLQLANAALNKASLETRPAMLLMSGDQVYTDDVSGPLLQAIHQVIKRLGLFSEAIPHPHYPDSYAIHSSADSYYRRNAILPHVNSEARLLDQLIGGRKLPIFSSRSADKHLITLAEMQAMYLLTWSEVLWQRVKFNSDEIPQPFQVTFNQELDEISSFSSDLVQVRRLLAHLPTYMIFDDHDITDDWNLTRGWEDAAYENAFAKRIIGNSLISYFIFQGWGNNPQRFPDSLIEQCRSSLSYLYDQENDFTAKESNDGRADKNLAGVELNPQDAFIQTLLQWEQWHYSIPASPKVFVLDTRTRRWRSETSLSRPSGLMDWEALTELQQELLDEDSVILVSAAPIFGIKFIEVIQRFFTYLGHALLVDAENWMAHPGSASVILNIFLHKRTPKNFIILSGDVHYSFVFDVAIRRRKHSPNIWQITASGIKNHFPLSLLKVFDWFDKWLYTSKSPLNFFTKRRRMKIKARRINDSKHNRLLNESAIGYLELDSQGKPTKIQLLTAKGQWIDFPERMKQR